MADTIITQQNLQDSLAFKEQTLNQINRSYYGKNPIGNAEVLNTIKSSIKISTGSMIGISTCYFTGITGPETALHEHVGHGWLGYRLTYNYGPGEGPTFQVDGWDNFKQIFKAGTLSDTLKAIWEFLIGNDINRDGASGVTWESPGTPNALGNAMGNDGLSAWISISGSVPTLLLTSASVAGGVAVQDKHPISGSALMTFGLMQHLMSSQYSWSAAGMSESQMVSEAAQGHDFANFALRIGKITGVGAKTVAMTTAAAWTLFVPLVALGTYLYKRSRQNSLVPNAVAAQAWMQKSLADTKTQGEFAKILQSYPKKDVLNKVWGLVIEKINSKTELSAADNALFQTYRQEMELFTAYLIEQIPQQSLKKAKVELLTEWKKQQGPSIPEKVLTALAVAESGGFVASRAIQLASKTLLPALAPVSAVLQVATPFLSSISVIAGSYETFRDLKSTLIPPSAKVLSVAKLVATVAVAAGIITTQLITGAAIAGFSTILLGISASLVLGYAKHQVVRSAFERQYSLQTDVWNSMFALFKKYHDAGQDWRGNLDLWKWVRYQHEAKAMGMLSPDQAEQLNNINFFTSTRPLNLLSATIARMNIFSKLLTVPKATPAMQAITP